MTSPRRRVSLNVALIGSILLLTACASQPPADPHHIGIVTEFAGLPSVNRNGKTYYLARQSKIYAGDIVNTDQDSRINVNMIDDTQIILGHDSHLVFHEYKYKPGAFFPYVRMSFTAGTFRARTENVTRAWFGNFEINTPLASIHAETADFWGRLDTEDNSLDVAMLDGSSIRVINQHGKVTISGKRFGTTVLAGSAPRSPRRWSDNRIQTALGIAGMQGYWRSP